MTGKLPILIILLSVGWYLLFTYKAGCRYDGDESLHFVQVFVTGANTGIGLQTAKELARRGAHVIMGCRSFHRCEEAKREVDKEVASGGQTFIEIIELDSLKSVKNCAERLIKNYPRLSVLINNAGIMGIPLTYTKDGVEMHFGVNHLGHYLLTKLLLPHLKSSKAPVRIINVSSKAALYALWFNGPKYGGLNISDLGHTANYGPFIAYSESKLANILHAKELARREPSVTVVSVHPGTVATSLNRQLPNIITYWLKTIGSYIFAKTPKEGAQTTLHCVLAPGLENHSGEFFSDCAVYRYDWNETLAEQLWNVSEELVANFS